MEHATKHFRKRSAILDCLRGTTTHPSADMVHEMLQADHPDISLATVYRNLSLFKNQGLIQSLGMIHGIERFDGNTAPHVHFVCNCCSAIHDLHQMGKILIHLLHRNLINILRTQILYPAQQR
jgi:Fur family peroxide stress response transcriptional regulator